MHEVYQATSRFGQGRPFFCRKRSAPRSSRPTGPQKVCCIAHGWAQGVAMASCPHGGLHEATGQRLGQAGAMPRRIRSRAAAGTAMRVAALIALMAAVPPVTSGSLVTATHSCTARGALVLASQAPCKVWLPRQMWAIWYPEPLRPWETAESKLAGRPPLVIVWIGWPSPNIPDTIVLVLQCWGTTESASTGVRQLAARLGRGSRRLAWTLMTPCHPSRGPGGPKTVRGCIKVRVRNLPFLFTISPSFHGKLHKEQVRAA